MFTIQLITAPPRPSRRFDRPEALQPLLLAIPLQLIEREPRRPALPGVEVVAAAPSTPDSARRVWTASPRCRRELLTLCGGKYNKTG